jgi:hypothetical protein
VTDIPVTRRPSSATRNDCHQIPAREQHQTPLAAPGAKKI